MRWKTARKLFPTSRRDTLICIGILSLAMLLCSMLRFLSEGDVYAALIFETAVIFVSRYTNGYLYGLVSSVIGVIGVNYMFTYPYFSLNFTISGYPLTCLLYTSDICSPMVGVFYRAPAENAAPFVQVGDCIHKGDVLCLIEAMKLMNEIVAEYDGVITEVCAENGQVVDYGHVLFRIERA